MIEPMFDLLSFARQGPGQRDQLSQAQMDQIARTARRAPEAVVKVLPKGATTAKAVRKHLDYVGRRGELDLETDEGTRLKGEDVGAQLVEDWDLDIDEERFQSDLSASAGRSPSKLVHKLMFSMPPGTSSSRVLAAVRNFAREEFALKHRYALALHTDEPHPHVHVVVKAMGEHGQRLNIYKATLREWRSEFVRHLRQQGIDANATPRFIRGQTKPQKSDGIYRAALRGESTHLRVRAESVAKELLAGRLPAGQAKAKLSQTRVAVNREWHAVAEKCARQGKPDLAKQIRQFVTDMPKPQTEKEYMADSIIHGRFEHRLLGSLRTR